MDLNGNMSVSEAIAFRRHGIIPQIEEPMNIRTKPDGTEVILPTKTEYERWVRVLRDMRTLAKFDVKAAVGAQNCLVEILETYKPLRKKPNEQK